MSAKTSTNEFYVKKDLLQRGWTGKLISEFFPEPLCRRTSYGATLRVYPKREVLKYEQDPRFIKLKTAQQAKQNKSARHKIQRFSEEAALFQEAFAALDPSDLSPAELLVVRRLHTAFLDSLQQTMYDASGKESTPANMEQSLTWVQNKKLNRDKDALRAVWEFRRLASMLFKNRTSQAEPFKAQAAQEYPKLLIRCAQAQLATLRAKLPETTVEQFLDMEPFPAPELTNRSLYQIYLLYYLQYAIQQDLSTLLEVDPKNEYPLARMLQRHFVIHVGPTNSGKTYESLQRLAAASSGVYLGPLRLLALEVQEKLLAKGVNCSLLTGEEEDLREGSTHVASTVEKADLSTLYDVVVIDECQMIGDSQRGFAWTRAILGMQCREIHCCVAPEGLAILEKLIDSCGDTYEVEELTRFTPLIFEKKPVYKLNELQPGDAVIAFSKRQVLFLAELLNKSGRKASVIYGRLPYPARKLQIENFLSGKNQYVVSTDAIGMGLNLPVRRIVFSETQKFDGTEVRKLSPEEVRQIAGRAGRRGLNEQGYVTYWEPFNGYSSSDGRGDLQFLKTAYHEEVRQLPFAYLGFSDLVLKVDYDILDILKAWQTMPVQSPLYRKMDIIRYIELIQTMRDSGVHLTKREELCAANIPFDEGTPELMELFLFYCQNYQEGRGLLRPHADRSTTDALEMYCKQLDLYYSFGKHFGYDVDCDWLREEKMNASQKIHSLLVSRMMAKQKKRRQRF